MAVNWRDVGPRGANGSLPTDAALPDGEWLEPLRAARRSGRSVLVLVNDSHRATPTRETLRQLAHRVELPVCRVLVATGTHRFSADEKARFERQTLDGALPACAGVGWHDADSGELVPLGDAHIHPWLLEHEVLLAIGSCEPHYFAGVTGAHKTLTIGVLSRAAIERNHAGALEPGSNVFALAGNPVHEGICAHLAALRGAGRTLLAINHVVVGGSSVATACGTPEQALADLLPTVRDAFQHRIERPVDVLWLVVEPPLNRSLYQADKALKNNHLAVRDGGAILLEAACPEGVGPDGFLRLLRDAPDYAAARDLVRRRGYQLGDHKAVKLRHLTDPAARGVSVALVGSAVSCELAALAGLATFDDAQAALGWLAGRVSMTEGLRIADAGNVCVGAR